MKHNWIAMLVVAGGTSLAMFGQQYPQRQPPYQGNPNYNGQDGNGQQYGNGQYDNTQPAYGPDGAYDGSEGVYAPAPPPIPSYAYQRPAMPGPGYYWVDGYWNFVGGRYMWVSGYWMLPPDAGAYWVAPRYAGGRFFIGFWGGGRRDFNRGYVGHDYRSYGRGPTPRPSSRAPEFRSYSAPSHSDRSFRGGDNRANRSGSRDRRGGRR